MDDLRINAISSVNNRVDNLRARATSNRDDNLDIYDLYHIMANSEISDGTKQRYLQKHRPEVERIVRSYLGSDEYDILLAQRPLLAFKPIKNAFTHHGDKLLLAQAIGVNPKHINSAIMKHLDSLKSTGYINDLTEDQVKSLKKYIYRHGSQDQVVSFFDYEVSNSKNIVNTLNKTLSYSTGGVADYFSRPIHKMKNTTLVQLANVVNAKIEAQKTAGTLTEAEAANLSDWALKHLLVIQHNSKPSSAIKKALS